MTSPLHRSTHLLAPKALVAIGFVKIAQKAWDVFRETRIAVAEQGDHHHRRRTFRAQDLTGMRLFSQKRPPSQA